MSLNQIVDQNYKIWLNPVVNSIKIDGDWTYKEAEKSSGDNLVLDSNLVARWVTLPPATPYGNAIAVRPAQQNINSSLAALTLNYLAPSSPLYSFNDNSDHITITFPGVYIAFANITYHNNVGNSVSMEFQKQDDIDSNLFTMVPGSKIRNFPSTTIFSTTSPNFQYTNLCTSAVFRTTVSNRQIKLACSGAASGNSLDSEYCSFVIVRVSTG